MAYIYICFANPSCFPSSTGITIVTLFTKCIQLTKPFTKRCKITLLCNRCSVTVYRYKSQVCRFCPVILQSLKFFYIYYVLNIDIILFRQSSVLQTSALSQPHRSEINGFSSFYLFYSNSGRPSLHNYRHLPYNSLHRLPLPASPSENNHLP